jgi:DNA/RNA endonuclease YhcR with UshA esterase domain
MKDGSGDIVVLGGRVEAASLEALGHLPRCGDQVDVTGSLSVSADQEIKLRMQSADQLLLRRKNVSIANSAPRVSLSDITVAHKGRPVAVVGKLKSIDVPGLGSKSPYVLRLEDNGAELAVIFWEDVFQGLENKLPIPGKFISARGKVEVYRDKVQLKVWAADDLCVVESMK